MKYLVTVKNKFGHLSNEILKCDFCGNDDFDTYSQLIINESPIINADNIESRISSDRDRTFCYKCIACSKVQIFERNLSINLK